MSIAAPFLLSVGVLMTEVTMLIMVVVLIHVIIDTIFMTVSVKAKETLIITNGFYEQQVFFIINTIQWEIEDMVWARSTLSLPCTISMV